MRNSFAWCRCCAVLAVYALAAMTRAATPPKAKTNVYVNQTWASGAYQYDGAGNIIGIGPHSDTSMTDVYRYDGVSRLVEATAHTGVSDNRQSFAYDVYGNLISSTRTETVFGGSTTYPSQWAVDPATNRLDNLGACTTGGIPCQYSNYDEAGNALGPDPTNYTWDPLGMMSELKVDPHYDRYLYDATNERIATARASTPGGAIQEWHYTIRGLDNKVTRELVDTVTGAAHSFRWEKDYVYRDGSLLAALTPDGGGEKRIHYHPDHLGTPRLITDDDGVSLAFHTYWPFGEEVNGSFTGSDPSSLRYTGHERDFGGTPAQDLDYMHARYYRPNWMRFLSVDPSGNDRLGEAQAWNRYAYVVNSPVGRVDADGLKDTVYWLQSFSSEHKHSAGSIPSHIGETPQLAGRAPTDPMFSVKTTFYADEGEITAALKNSERSDYVVIQAHSGSTQMALHDREGSNGGITARSMMAALSSGGSAPSAIILAGCNSQVVGRELAKSGTPVVAAVGGIPMSTTPTAVTLMLKMLNAHASLEMAVAAANDYLKTHPRDCGKDDCSGHFAVMRKTDLPQATSK